MQCDPNYAKFSLAQGHQSKTSFDKISMTGQIRGSEEKQKKNPPINFFVVYLVTEMSFDSSLDVNTAPALIPQPTLNISRLLRIDNLTSNLIRKTSFIINIKETPPHNTTICFFLSPQFDRSREPGGRSDDGNQPK